MRLKSTPHTATTFIHHTIHMLKTHLSLFGRIIITTFCGAHIGHVLEYSIYTNLSEARKQTNSIDWWKSNASRPPHSHVDAGGGHCNQQNMNIRISFAMHIAHRERGGGGGSEREKESLPSDICTHFVFCVSIIMDNGISRFHCKYPPMAHYPPTEPSHVRVCATKN